MDDSLLRKIDFNSLKLLKILGEERNTKRTAERMFLSQPAVSKQLKRLRDEFGDELFIRKQYGLEPTDFGFELLEKLPTLFDALEEVFAQNQQFLPLDYKGEICIAINASLYQPVAQRFFHHLRPLLPQATLKFVSWGFDTEQELKLGKVHIGINFYPLDISKMIVQKKLSYCDFKLVCRDNHPVLKTERKVSDIGQYPIAQMQHPDFNKAQSLIEKKLFEAGVTPFIGFRADQLAICLDVVSHTDSILPCVDVFNVALPDGVQFFMPHKDDQIGTDIGTFVPSKIINTPLLKWLTCEVNRMEARDM